MTKISQKLIIAVILANLFIPNFAYAADFSQIASLPIVSHFTGVRNFLVDTAQADSENAVVLPISGKREADKKVNAVITAYTSTVDQCDDDPFIAASGKHVYDGMIAANWLPLGTKIKIPALYGDKIFTVDDRMNARYGYGRMDIWLDATKDEARKFGVKRVEVEVYYDYNK